MGKTKKITNFNALRPVIIAAHKDGNRKAISKDMVNGAGVDIGYFNEWQKDVNALRETVWEYVQKKKNARYDAEITEDAIYAARERIYPKWKDVLQVGEAEKDTKQLRVDESDVEDLIGFAWDFMATAHCTVETRTSEQIFRKKVESLLGCAIAKNAVLDDTERDTLQEFYSAQKSIQKNVDKISELKSSIKNFESLKKSLPETEVKFAEYIDRQVKGIKEEMKAAEEAKTKAEENLARVSADAMSIQKKIKVAK